MLRTGTRPSTAKAQKDGPVKMEDDWWPECLAHIPQETTWSKDKVIVAEIKDYEDEIAVGHRLAFTALVPCDQLDDLRESLGNIDHRVSTSGPRPFASADHAYEPRFWVEAYDLPGAKYEPLVLSWQSHNQSVLLPDPGLLMTYGLVPRTIGDGATRWDDPAAPTRDIVKVTAASTYDFPRSTPASVEINTDYLQDYLSLRHVALVYVYWEERFVPLDEELTEILGKSESIEIKLPDRRFQISRFFGGENAAVVQVWGGKVIGQPGEFPISNRDQDVDKLEWPGFDGPMTRARAWALRMPDYVYVKDSVLEYYEGQHEYSIGPESGSVSFGSQWSIGYCSRVGRDLIRLELKKLYEGVPSRETIRWHKCVVEPLPTSAYPDILHEPNIASRAKKLTYSLVELGESLSRLARAAGTAPLSATDFVGLRRESLDYSGWWSPERISRIAHHNPLDLSMGAFLDRCMSLDQLLVEGLQEKSLRQLCAALDVPADQSRELRSLKLLHTIVRFAELSNANGLSIASDSKELWQRYDAQGVRAEQPLTRLFAIREIRILKGHMATDKRKELTDELERFGILPGEEASGYGLILDRVYDELIDQLAAINRSLRDALTRT